MSKPFDRELAKKEEVTRKKLVEKLNKVFKRLKAEVRGGKNADIVIYDRKDPSTPIYLEMEGARPDRWDKIKTGKYPTVRWPLAKKEKYKDFKAPLVMATVRDDEEVSDICVIDYDTWIKEGHEEKERYVRAGGKAYSYRKGGEEPFWAIARGKAHWGYEGLEEYLISVLEKWKAKNVEPSKE
ncbi:MAG: hypothetical protein QW580_06895 [Nitrososphaerota archaeon]